MAINALHQVAELVLEAQLDDQGLAAVLGLDAQRSNLFGLRD